MSSLTPRSRVILATKAYLDTGVHIDSFGLSPEEKHRMEVAFHLYRVWKNNISMDKREFLLNVYGRRPQDIPNDLYVFEFIKKNTHDLLLSKEDLLVMQQQAVVEGFQAARQNGESSTLLKAADKLKQLADSLPENTEDKHEDIDDFYTDNIKDIAPDFIPVDSVTRNRLLAKYGGVQDKNAKMVEDKTAKLLKESQPGVAEPIEFETQWEDDADME